MTLINNRINACIVGLVTVLMAPSAIAQTMVSSEIAQIAKSITVQIESQAPGSGVLINKAGNIYTILTAAHVVETDDEYEIITPDGESHPFQSQQVKKFDGIDLAVIEFESAKDYRVADIGNSTQSTSGKSIYVAGFPAPTAVRTESTFNFSEGKVRANATRPLADGYALIYSNWTSTGMSGGAVLDEQGRLVGIHGRADAEEHEREGESVFVKTGNNLGIPINRYISLIQGGTGNISQTQTTALIADDHFLQGTESLKQRDYQGAIDYFDKAIAINPDFTIAYVYRGNVRFELGDKARAIEDYNKAIAINPNLAEAYYNRANALSILGEKLAAIEDFDKAISTDPGYFAAYNNRGLTRYELGNRAGAIADYDKAIEIKPDYVGAYLNRVYARYSLGDKSGANADFNRALAINPDYVETFLDRVVAGAELDDKSDNAEAYSRQGAVRALLGDYAGAIAALNKTIAINPNDVDAYKARGTLRAKLGDYTGAITDFEKAILINPDSADAYYSRGYLRSSLGDKVGAIADYDKAIALNLDFAEAYYNRGSVRYTLGDVTGAIADLEKAVTLFQQRGNQAGYKSTMDLLKQLSNSP